MNKMFYTKSARYWDEALPLGNGRLGAMVYGKVNNEVIQVNEETLWNGLKKDRINPDSFKNLGKIREYIHNNEISEAETLAVHALSGVPQYQRCYQTLGEIHIKHLKELDLEKITDYRRELDLETAEVSVKYQYGNTCYQENIFVSHPADAMVVRLKATGEEKLNISCRIDRDRYSEKAYAPDEASIICDGNTGGRYFLSRLCAHSTDGTVSTIGEHLIVQNASYVVLTFSAATDYNHESPFETVDGILKNLKQYTYGELQENHRADYCGLFKKMDLHFEGDTSEEVEALPLNERLDRLKEGKDDNGIFALYFQYSRYLMISSSRKGGLPANLQGIWNELLTPPWDSKYTININLQMNYWFVDMCNLSECYAPFFELLKRVQKSGQITAEKMYQCRGFVAHHNTDIYADTAPQDHYIPASYWVMGGAWLCLHIWEHYLFTQDKKFLEEHYKIIEDSILFFIDFLVEDEDGVLITTPSVSPENTYIKDGKEGRLCEAPAMDTQILTDLFKAYISLVDELGIESEILDKVKEMLPKIPAPKIGKHGQIMEWKEDYDEAEPGHRHISQLFGVFPSAQINYESTPELMEAAKVTLNRRLQYGGGHTGWSRAWIILLWDRFCNGEKAYDNLVKLLCNSTFDNFMDNHPYDCPRGKVFQIDGNFGAAAGIAEMLIQSQNDRIRILPALPEKFKSGYVKGLRVRGAGEVSMRWENGKLQELMICADQDKDYIVVYDGVEKQVHLSAGSSWMGEF